MPMCSNWCKSSGTWRYTDETCISWKPIYHHLLGISTWRSHYDTTLDTSKPPRAILSPVDLQQSATTVTAHYQENTYYSCGTVQELHDKFYEADSLTSLLDCVHHLAIIEYLKEAGFFHVIWQVYESEIRNVKSHKPQNPDYYITEFDKWIAENTRKMCRMAIMSWRTCVVKQTQFHSIPALLPLNQINGFLNRPGLFCEDIVKKVAIC